MAAVERSYRQVVDTRKELHVMAHSLPVEVVSDQNTARAHHWPKGCKLEKRFLHLVRRIKVDDIGCETREAESFRSKQRRCHERQHSLRVIGGNDVEQPCMVQGRHTVAFC